MLYASWSVLETLWRSVGYQHHTGHSPGLEIVAVGNGRIATSSWDDNGHKTKLWDADSGRCLQVFYEPQLVSSLASLRSILIASSFVDGIIKVRDTDSGRYLQTLRHELVRPRDAFDDDRGEAQALTWIPWDDEVAKEAAQPAESKQQ
eukprot:gnl/TRDRNA2_/TRDRNA2_125651_c1_seq1.p1 gnl/TRDRNA2_/TRDRNA2_125651_c1~~gnl/TRDRNA2_/TRDRNA2_125651_c1_seq1.p1  ORF type:complete len:148 (+),score=19.14 gnl/TRDRNA2_/TRDRNA2_125651_c1_seq1:137-580(+)